MSQYIDVFWEKVDNIKNRNNIYGSNCYGIIKIGDGE